MSNKTFYRISIKGIVINDRGRILLSKEDNGKWEMLGGGLEHGEKPLDCLKREVHEETGLVITKIYPKPKYFVTSERDDDPETWIANVIYQIELDSLDFTPSDECQELKFFSLEEMKLLDSFPNVKELVKILESETKN